MGTEIKTTTALKKERTGLSRLCFYPRPCPLWVMRTVHTETVCVPASPFNGVRRETLKDYSTKILEIY